MKEQKVRYFEEWKQDNYGEWTWAKSICECGDMCYLNINKLGKIDKKMEIGEFLPAFLVLEFLQVFLDFIWLNAKDKNQYVVYKDQTDQNLILILIFHLCLHSNLVYFRRGSQHAWLWRIYCAQNVHAQHSRWRNQVRILWRSCHSR